MVQQSEVSCRMNEKEKKNEQKNTVVEAMLRAREKEMQQPPTEEELPGLTPEEYDDMYLKIVGRLKAEGLLRKEDMEDGGSETEDTGKEGVFRKENVSGTMSSGEVSEEKRTEPETAEKIPAEKEQTREEEIRKEPVSRRPAKIRRFRQRAAKAACVCLVAAAAMFGLSMTSEANRLRLLQTANEVLGTGDLLKANNGDDRAISAGSEDEARQEIADTLNVEVPEFLYLPEGMEYMTYELIDDIGYAKIHYSYQKGFLYLEISNSLSDMSQGNIKENQKDEDEAEEIETLSGKMNFVIKNAEEGKEQYIASWEYKNVAYNFYGEISYEELMEILKNISFSM